MMHGGSCGGYGTKACVIADSAGRAVVFALAPGQAHGLPHYVPLLARLPGVSIWVVADRGYSYRLRQHTDLLPEHTRSNVLLRSAQAAESTPRRRGRPPKHRAKDQPPG